MDYYLILYDYYLIPFYCLKAECITFLCWL